jgi:hypothetical protein
MADRWATVSQVRSPSGSLRVCGSASTRGASRTQTTRSGSDVALFATLGIVLWSLGCSSPGGAAGGQAVDAQSAADVLLQVTVDAAEDTAAADTDDVVAPDPQDVAAADVDPADGFFDPEDGLADATGNDVKAGATAPPWLLSIDNGSRKLLKIDIVTGKTAAICTLPNGFSYPSLTFRRDNVLVASRKGAALDQINPCTCEVVAIGVYGAATGVNGITSNHAQGLFGISAGLQTLISIDPQTGVGTSIGKLGAKFGANGATWSDAIHALYAINSADDTLYVVDPATGVATPQATLSQKFGSVGVERHPGNGQIYACTDDGMLRKVDPVTGNVTVIGPLGETGACSNLAAPWGPVQCIDDVKIP